MQRNGSFHRLDLAERPDNTRFLECVCLFPDDNRGRFISKGVSKKHLAPGFSEECYTCSCQAISSGSSQHRVGQNTHLDRSLHYDRRGGHIGSLPTAYPLGNYWCRIDPFLIGLVLR
jgi:hypothetical protein